MRFTHIWHVPTLLLVAAACTSTRAPMASNDVGFDHAVVVDDVPATDLAELRDVRDDGVLRDQTFARDDGSRDVSDASSAPDVTKSAANPIVLENQRMGTTQWLIRQASNEHQVEGYASVVSVNAGETFSLHVNVSAAHRVRWQAYRLGFYGGSGARLIAEGAEQSIEPQPACSITRDTGMVSCRWNAAFTVRTDSSWVTGEYLIKLLRDDGFERYVPLVVRDDTRRAPLLFQASVNTWQAYNDWGGTGLYANRVEPSVFDGPHAFAVSFDRPYAAENGSGEMLYWEQRMLKWLEQRGYDVAYVANTDIDANPGLLRERRMFLSVGHDEYWSTGERDALDTARDAGLSIGFFTADTGTYQVRYIPSATGTARRAYICYKTEGSNRDPDRGTPRQTTRFSEPVINRPENALLGVMYAQWTGGARFPMVVRRASHWIYDGTGVVDGDTLARIVGSEYDRVHDNGRTPAGLEVIAESMGLSREGIVDASHATVYYPTRTSLVFAAGTLTWAHALGRDDIIDARIQRMTENILARAGLTLDKPMVVPPPRAPQSPGTASSVTLIAGDGVAGYADGAGPRARFNMPAGVAVGSGGELYVTDTQNHRVRAVHADGSVTTLAGCGPSGALRSARFRDASGADACFDAPTGIAVSPDGTVYVADTNNHRIRAITPAGVVTTYAGMGEPGMRDDVPARARFSRPRGLAWGADGALYVADAGNDAIRRVTRTGVTTLARGLDNVLSVALGSEGEVYAITGNAMLVVVRGANTTRLTGSPYGFGFIEGAAATARISPGDGIALLGRSVLFADAYTLRVRAYALDTQRVNTFVGDGRWGSTLGTGAQTRLAVPRGMAPYREGVALVDSANHRVLYARP